MTQYDDSAEQSRRRQNIESILGPMHKRKPPSYTVRLNEDLRSIAKTHPALNDVNLWKLLAQRNGMSTACDGKGNPETDVRRGQKLLLPSAQEIAEFRRASPSAKRKIRDTPTVAITKLERASKECPNCRRLTTESATVCPACGYSFDTSIEAPAVTEIDPNTIKMPPVNMFDDNLFYAPTTIVELPASPHDGNTLSLDDKTVNISQNSNESVKRHGSFYDSTMQSEDTYRLEDPPHDSARKAESNSAETLRLQDSFYAQPAPPSQQDNPREETTTDSPHGETVVERIIEDLSAKCRLVRTHVRRHGVRISRAQLEVKKEDRWTLILFYEVSELGSIRQELLPSGGMVKIKIELPLQLAQEMVDNDLSSNWQSYCKKFLAGKKLLA